MKYYYSILIPKPCHEDWNTMTPKEKGRFCDTCSKTVIDFTAMKTQEIQDFIAENKSNRICGHFKQTQLDSINLHIPSHVLSKQHSFHKLFLLALMIVMGTSLFSCTNRSGNKQKIDSIEVVDTINKNVINVLEEVPKKMDTISEKTNPEKIILEEILTDGELIIETVGDIEIIENQTLEIDSIKVIDPPEIEGKIEIMGDMITEGEVIFGIITVETPPEFPNTSNQLNRKEKQDYFSKKVSEFVLENFIIPQGDLDFKGKQRVSTQFKIDSLGIINDIRVRAPHKWLEKEAIRILSLLPKFIPAKHNGKPVEMVYSLPIIFQVEE